jgi:hypothetical protein
MFRFSPPPVAGEAVRGVGADAVSVAVSAVWRDAGSSVVGRDVDRVVLVVRPFAVLPARPFPLAVERDVLDVVARFRGVVLPSDFSAIHSTSESVVRGLAHTDAPAGALSLHSVKQNVKLH